MDLDEHERIALDQAARGCISGVLTEWPVLVSSLQKCGAKIKYPEHVHALAAGDMARIALEVLRLKRGDFTPEEIHDICHNLHGKVSAKEFSEGCAAEQKKLYGAAYHEELLNAARAAYRTISGDYSDGGPIMRDREVIAMLVSALKNYPEATVNL